VVLQLLLVLLIRRFFRYLWSLSSSASWKELSGGKEPSDISSDIRQADTASTILLFRGAHGTLSIHDKQSAGGVQASFPIRASRPTCSRSIGTTFRAWISILSSRTSRLTARTSRHMTLFSRALSAILKHKSFVLETAEDAAFPGCARYIMDPTNGRNTGVVRL
jgi:hypothetical protein